MGDRQVTVIAEAGVNHDGSLERALALVRAAAETGADAVKFQTFRARSVARGDAPKARYQLKTTAQAESQVAMLKRLELSPDAHRQVRDASRAAGLEFLSTPFDLPSVRVLQDLGVSRLKVSSGDLTNEPLLRAVAGTGLPLIISTGMATLDEVEWALGVVASECPAEAGPNVTLLHCTSEYPAPIDEVNLRAIETLRSAFGLPVGFSDHTVGLAAPVAAVALGAVVIEKHFTLDRNLPGPDHAASMEPDDFRAMVAAIREVEAALGDGRKVPSPSELENRKRVRRSLVAKSAIRAGEAFTADNLDVKRPADGVSASRYSEFLGRTARRDYAPDEPIDE